MISKMKFKTLVSKNITQDELFEYLTAPFGYTFGLYADGSTAVGQDVGLEIAEDERPIVTVKCPGRACDDGDMSQDLEELRDRLVDEYAEELRLDVERRQAEIDLRAVPDGRFWSDCPE